MSKPIRRLFTKEMVEQILKQYMYKVERKSGHSYKAKVTSGPEEGSFIVELMEK